MLDCEFLAKGRSDHLLDEVDAGNELGHRVLDLKPRVHFEKIKAPILRGDEFDRSGKIIMYGPGQSDRLFAHRVAGLLADEWRRCFLNDFLMAALDRTFALAKMNDVAVLIAEDLDFDVTRTGNEFFDEDPAIAERGFGFDAARAKPSAMPSANSTIRIPLPPPPAEALIITGLSDCLGDLFRSCRVINDAGKAWHDCDAGGLSEPFGFDLIAHRLDGSDVGANESDVGFLQCLRERRLLRQKPIARVDRIRARRLAGRDDIFDDKVAFWRGRRPDPHRFVRQLHMRRVLVSIGIYGDRRNPHFPRGFDHPAGDLTTVRDEDFFEHPKPPTNSTLVKAGSHYHVADRACRQTKGVHGTNWAGRRIDRHYVIL